jgi:DHA1 family bicyclomycin/chloramphenicol resistance-like MFS transporter
LGRNAAEAGPELSGFVSTPSDRNAATKTMPHVPLWLLTVITFSGTLAMHVFLPALPRAAEDLHVSVGAIQMTVSIYIFGLAAGQLVYGPLSDRFGRRPVLLAGLALFTVAGFATAVAPDLPSLLVARLFQALGGCAGLVLGRAIVRDTADMRETGRRLAVMNLMVTLGPGAAPLVGGFLSSTFGWRSIFFAMFAFGVANFLFTWRLLPETGMRGANASAATLVRHYGELLRSRSFIAYSVGGSCCTSAMYAIIAPAPFIFQQQLNRPAFEVGIYLTVFILGAWIGSMVVTRLIVRGPLDRLVNHTSLLVLGTALFLLVAVLAGYLSVILVVSCMFVLGFAGGFSSPAVTAQAVSVNMHVVGSASGLFGCIQMAVGGLCTTLVGIGDNPALAAALVLTGAGIIAQVSFWIAARYPDPSEKN